MVPTRTVLVHQNNVVGNAFGARYNGATETIDAQLNWWGSPTGPFNAVNNPGGTGKAVSNNIDAYLFRTTGAGSTPCSGGPATTLLAPFADTNPVGTQHCVTATVTNAVGVPQPGVTVRFTVTGSVATSGSATTDANGQATFCYTGPALPGADVIRAFADTDNDSVEDPGEPFGEASKMWILPVTTPGCEIKITNGGWIIANNSDRANPDECPRDS